MSDFAQTGSVTTLQRLNDTHLAAIEHELTDAAPGIAVILPVHTRDAGQPALAHIAAELRAARWVSEIIITANGPDESAQQKIRDVFARAPLRLLWNGPGGGKGSNLARAFAATGAHRVLAVQDCDVASFRAADLARLCHPVALMGFDFAKAYYSRATDRLYGRVTRLFFFPLLRACLHVAGHQPLLDFLLGFRYPLAGEIALAAPLAQRLSIADGWGVETGMLCEVFRTVEPRRVCQVDGGSGYDHKHQPAETALAKMAAEIAAELLRQLAAEGAIVDAAFRASLLDAWHRESAGALERSAALARINALPHDAAAERAIVAEFARALSE